MGSRRHHSSRKQETLQQAQAVCRRSAYRVQRRDSLAALGFSTWQDYTASDHWQALKRSILRPAASHCCCTVCGSRATALWLLRPQNMGCETHDDVLPVCHYHYRTCCRHGPEYACRADLIDFLRQAWDQAGRRHPRIAPAQAPDCAGEAPAQGSQGQGQPFSHSIQQHPLL